MTMFGYSELPARPVRALRRLNHSTIVKTSYLSRVAEIEVADEESSEAARQGYEDGYAGGLAKAALEAAATREEEHKRVELALAAVSKALASVQEADSLLRSELGTTVPKVAFALLEELLGRELELSANPGREAVARALALVESSQHATIRLNPRDIELLGDIGDLPSAMKHLSLQTRGLSQVVRWWMWVEQPLMPKSEPPLSGSERSSWVRSRLRWENDRAARRVGR